jgi:hypothetical protein
MCETRIPIYLLSASSCNEPILDSDTTGGSPFLPLQRYCSLTKSFIIKYNNHKKGNLALTGLPDVQPIEVPDGWVAAPIFTLLTLYLPLLYLLGFSCTHDFWPYRCYPFGDCIIGVN